MGKSSSSCLKIIACGSDTVENDDVEVPEAKVSGDKRGWSFRKRSGRHRVLGNNVSSETPTSAEKVIQKATNTDYQAPVKSISPDEKPQMPRPAEKIAEPDLATEKCSESKISAVIFASENGSNAAYAESKTCQTVVALENGSNARSAESRTSNEVVVSENESDTMSADLQRATAGVSGSDSETTLGESKIADSVIASENGGEAVFLVMDEPVAIIIQTAIRGFLAQRELVQLKSAMKLQAAIRGHLVRRNAVETLHCIQAIVKVQSLVRARSSKVLDHKNEPSNAQFSTAKLLQNSFACQLLESTPKRKSVNIRCDPLRPNSAWSWLERWMSVSTSEVAQKLEPEDGNQVMESASQPDAEFSSMIHSDSLDSKFNSNSEVKSLENEENHIIHDVDTVASQSCYPFSTEGMTEKSLPKIVEIIHEDVASVKIDALANVTSESQVEPISLVDKPAEESNQPKLSTKRSASGDLDAEGTKFVYGSRKTSNPAFIAAQSKFEELSSALNSVKSTGSSHQDAEAESHVSTTFMEESVTKADEPVEISAPSDPRIHVAVSECGTELSISSTLDSPDRFDFGVGEAEQEVKSLMDTSHDPNSKEGLDSEANGMSSNYVTDLSSDLIQQEEVQKINDASVNPVVAQDSSQVDEKLEMSALDSQSNFKPPSSVLATDSSLMEQKHELSGCNVQIEDGSGVAHEAYKSSPEASPKSHITVPESQGTPSSQVSVKGNRKKIDKSGSNTKRNSLSAGKRSPSNPTHDSGARSSTEHLPKDHKSGKRRNSFGSTKSENADQELRESGGRNSLPSYMQATESARAKAHSPRSSPDVHDKEVYTKKRHSLPGAGGRQGSPRVQQSTSPTTQGTKANGSHPSTERKWQR